MDHREEECQRAKGEISARLNHPNTCVRLWDSLGCKGKSIQVKHTRVIGDVRTEGLSSIWSLSGCDYKAPNTAEVKLYQHSYWFWWGSPETFVINRGECKDLTYTWWNDRTSAIGHESENCFQVWRHVNCTGSSYCFCGSSYYKLQNLIMFGNITWNDQISSMSLCDYPS